MIVEHLNKMKEIIIDLIPTGHPVTTLDELVYIDTLLIDDGDLVFHCFERIPR